MKKKREEIRNEETPRCGWGRGTTVRGQLFLRELEGSVEYNGVWLAPGYSETYKQTTARTPSLSRQGKRRRGVHVVWGGGSFL